MTDQELAEKIAKLRGYEYRGCYFVGDRWRKGWCHKDTDEGETLDEYPEFIFDDSQFLPMVKEAEEKGWLLEIKNGWVHFKKPRGIMNWIYTTGTGFRDESYTPMIAMCREWIEAMEMEPNNE